MALAQEMFAIAPARGRPDLTPDQEKLLAGQALHLHALAAAGLPVIASIALTRAAWTALKQERDGQGNRLRMAWVACLFRLVALQGRPPRLVVRPCPAIDAANLVSAYRDIEAPQSEMEAVDPGTSLGRALEATFLAMSTLDGARQHAGAAAGRPDDLVMVQAMAEGALLRFITREPQTGVLGPIFIEAGAGADVERRLRDLNGQLDAVTGIPLTVTIATDQGQINVVSARPVQGSAAGLLDAAVERVERGVWTSGQAVSRFDPGLLALLLHPRLTAGGTAVPIATGLGVSPGAASGLIVFTPEDAARVRARGRHCILVVTETGPADIEGMKAATGILTARGGMTSHAAVIARITGKPCVAGVRSLEVDGAEMTCSIGGRQFRSGDRITIDGNDGNLYAGSLPLSRPHIGGALGRLLGWSDLSRTISVRTNAETVEAARTALSFGAEGIGLARSEHMFFSHERMVALRRLILSEDESDRAEALKGLVDFQSGDYADLFSTMAGRPVTVRLFDPPLHEFLPRTEEDIAETAASLGVPLRALRNRLDKLSEVNPMLGHRGVRLAITYPEILEMQVQALLAGVRSATARQREPVVVEVMVPFVSTASEVAWIRDRVLSLARQSPEIAGGLASFSFGTMIELPRACLRAGEIATAVDFFSFGTNDLTQTTYGISRDDAPAFLAAYHRMGLYEADPFVTIDQKGVGELIALAISRGKANNPALKIGICGEHAGDAASLRFFAKLGIDYVSCSPYRVPIARLALAQA